MQPTSLKLTQVKPAQSKDVTFPPPEESEKKNWSSLLGDLVYEFTNDAAKKLSSYFTLVGGDERVGLEGEEETLQMIEGAPPTKASLCPLTPVCSEAYFVDVDNGIPKPFNDTDGTQFSRNLVLSAGPAVQSYMEYLIAMTSLPIAGNMVAFAIQTLPNATEVREVGCTLLRRVYYNTTDFLNTTVTSQFSLILSATHLFPSQKDFLNGLWQNLTLINGTIPSVPNGTIPNGTEPFPTFYPSPTDSEWVQLELRIEHIGSISILCAAVVCGISVAVWKWCQKNSNEHQADVESSMEMDV
jgi:hypothetical protein